MTAPGLVAFEIGLQLLQSASSCLPREQTRPVSLLPLRSESRSALLLVQGHILVQVPVGRLQDGGEGTRKERSAREHQTWSGKSPAGLAGQGTRIGLASIRPGVARWLWWRLPCRRRRCRGLCNRTTAVSADDRSPRSTPRPTRKPPGWRLLNYNSKVKIQITFCQIL